MATAHHTLLQDGRRASTTMRRAYRETGAAVPANLRFGIIGRRRA
jgi:hypothetical protein